MADTVRYLMEQMIPELEDMQHKGYFSKDEIAKIVQRRQDFEYQLKRKAALKQDYLRYIDYEMKLDALRKHRRKQLAVTGKQTVADHAMVRRVHFIYERATRKFKSDLGLWCAWLDWCKASNSTKQMGKVASKALKLHSTEAGLWIYAASWEFEHNGNAAAARALMQQGLRMCKGSQRMWLEYFRMELLYVQKLRERRRVLGIDDDAADQQASAAATSIAQSSDGSTDADMQAPEEERQQGQATDESEAAVQAVLSGAVAGVVLRSAIKAIPQDLGFRARLLELLAGADFAGARALEAQILESITRDFGQSPEAVDLLARRGVDPNNPSTSDEAIAAAAQRYEDSLTASSSAGGQTAWRPYLTFLQQRLDAMLTAAATAAAEGSSSSQGASRRAAAAAAQLFKALRRGHDAGGLDEGLYGAWGDTAVRVGQPKMALRAVRLACDALPQSAAVWQRRLALEQQLHSSQAEANGHLAAAAVAEAAEAAVKAVPLQQAPVELWTDALAVCGSSVEALGRVQKVLLEQLAGGVRGPVSGGSGAIAGEVLRAVWQLQGPEAARKLYGQLLRLPPAGADMFRAMAALEMAGASAQGPASGHAAGGSTEAGGRGSVGRQQRVRAVYDAGVAAYGANDAALWVEFLLWEQGQGRGAGDVYRRAMRALKDPDAFVVLMQQQQQQQQT